jgi:Lrp/AsnC family leucine-responsive transcriptional regulator
VPAAITPLDDFDLKLLAALQTDVRQTHQHLAEQVHLSASQVSRRIQRLTDSGLVRGAVALLQPAAVGLAVTAYVLVTLRRHDQGCVRLLGQDLVLQEEVVEMSALTGEADYLLKLRCHDMQHLSAFLSERLMSHSEIATVKTSIVLQPLKETTRVSLAYAQKMQDKAD